MPKKSGIHQKDKFNPSSRNLPKEGESLEGENYSSCYAPKQSQDKILRKIAENARQALEEKLIWERKCYQDIIKIVALIFFIIGLIFGTIIGGVIF